MSSAIFIYCTYQPDKRSRNTLVDWIVHLLVKLPCLDKFLFLSRDSLKVPNLTCYYSSVVCCQLICLQSHALGRSVIHYTHLDVIDVICKVAPHTVVWASL